MLYPTNCCKKCLKFRKMNPVKITTSGENNFFKTTFALKLRIDVMLIHVHILNSASIVPCNGTQRRNFCFYKKSRHFHYSSQTSSKLNGYPLFCDIFCVLISNWYFPIFYNCNTWNIVFFFLFFSTKLKKI